MADEGGIAELEGPALVELLIIVRAALAVNDFGTGLGFLEMLTSTVDRLAGVGGSPAMLQPSEAASLLYCTSELCSLYNHEERAEDYAHAFLGVVRLAHGEGSKEVVDAHSFLCALFTRRKRFEEAVLHASSTLKIRQRYARSDSSFTANKAVADSHWNLAVLQYQLGQHRAALDSLEAARDRHVSISGEGVATSNVDLALGQVWTILGEHVKAMRSYRQVVRWRQRTLGFAHAETRRAAGLLAAAEIEAHAEEEHRRDLEQDLEDEDQGPVARPRPRQRPIEDLPPAQQRALLAAEPLHQAVPPQFNDEILSITDTSAVQSPAGGMVIGAAPARAPSPTKAPATGSAALLKNLQNETAKHDKQLERDRRRSQQAHAADFQEIEVTAGPEDKPLGFKPSAIPPGAIFLKSVDQDSWAERVGFKAGMELISIGDADVKNMSPQEFKAALQVRPQKLKCGPGRGQTAPATADPGRQNTPGGAAPDLKTFKVPEAVKTIGCLFVLYLQVVSMSNKWMARRGQIVTASRLVGNFAHLTVKCPPRCLPTLSEQL